MLDYKTYPAEKYRKLQDLQGIVRKTRGSNGSVLQE